jgi:hypothetical protein
VIHLDRVRLVLDPAATGGAQRVDTDHLAGLVQQRAAAVTRVDGRRVLDQRRVLGEIRADLVPDDVGVRHVAGRGGDACRAAALRRRRIAERHHGIRRGEIRIRAERQGRDVRGHVRQLDHGHVLARRARDDVRAVLLPVGQLTREGGRALDHVSVRQYAGTCVRRVENAGPADLLVPETAGQLDDGRRRLLDDLLRSESRFRLFRPFVISAAATCDEKKPSNRSNGEHPSCFQHVTTRHASSKMIDQTP